MQIKRGLIVLAVLVLVGCRTAVPPVIDTRTGAGQDAGRAEPSVPVTRHLTAGTNGDDSLHEATRNLPSVLIEMADANGFRFYALASDESMKHVPIALQDRPLYVLDFNKMAGKPTEETAPLMFLRYVSPQQDEDSEEIVMRKIKTTALIGEMRRASIWVRTERSGTSNVLIYTARPKVRQQIDNTLLEFQKEIQIVFLSKDASRTMIGRAMAADLAKTGNGLLASNLDIEDRRLVRIW